ncbi:hypothetical protein HPB52_009700 [Rhipicephalus sanguineus]|uniref:Uncharacterized protein n=1 Tax=Rhipicephalus sanguineus TaxID=34632 RepID=A0A9D4T978_RHISA|nr:hypothetical protein HPB52_009700 [Rhipicephalus sanguineus]
MAIVMALMVVVFRGEGGSRQTLTRGVSAACQMAVGPGRCTSTYTSGLYGRNGSPEPARCRSDTGKKVRESVSAAETERWRESARAKRVLALYQEAKLNIAKEAFYHNSRGSGLLCEARSGDAEETIRPIVLECTGLRPAIRDAQDSGTSGQNTTAATNGNSALARALGFCGSGEPPSWEAVEATKRRLECWWRKQVEQGRVSCERVPVAGNAADLKPRYTQRSLSQKIRSASPCSAGRLRGGGGAMVVTPYLRNLSLIGYFSCKHLDEDCVFELFHADRSQGRKGVRQPQINDRSAQALPEAKRAARENSRAVRRLQKPAQERFDRTAQKERKGRNSSFDGNVNEMDDKAEVNDLHYVPLFELLPISGETQMFGSVNQPFPTLHKGTEPWNCQMLPKMNFNIRMDTNVVHVYENEENAVAEKAMNSSYIRLPYLINELNTIGFVITDKSLKSSRYRRLSWRSIRSRRRVESNLDELQQLIACSCVIPVSDACRYKVIQCSRCTARPPLSLRQSVTSTSLAALILMQNTAAPPLSCRSTSRSKLDRQARNANTASGSASGGPNSSERLVSFTGLQYLPRCGLSDPADCAMHDGSAEEERLSGEEMLYRHPHASARVQVRTSALLSNPKRHLFNPRIDKESPNKPITLGGPPTPEARLELTCPRTNVPLKKPLQQRRECFQALAPDDMCTRHWGPDCLNAPSAGACGYQTVNRAGVRRVVPSSRHASRSALLLPFVASKEVALAAPPFDDAATVTFLSLSGVFRIPFSRNRHLSFVCRGLASLTFHVLLFPQRALHFHGSCEEGHPVRQRPYGNHTCQERHRKVLPSQQPDHHREKDTLWGSPLLRQEEACPHIMTETAPAPFFSLAKEGSAVTRSPSTPKFWPGSCFSSHYDKRLPPLRGRRAKPTDRWETLAATLAMPATQTLYRRNKSLTITTEAGRRHSRSANECYKQGSTSRSQEASLAPINKHKYVPTIAASPNTGRHQSFHKTAPRTAHTYTHKPIAGGGGHRIVRQ